MESALLASTPCLLEGGYGATPLLKGLPGIISEAGSSFGLSMGSTDERILL